MASKPSRAKRWIVVALVSFVLLEVSYRAYLTWLASPRTYGRAMPFALIPPENRIYRPHPYTSYALTEGFVSRDGRNRHNALGYRGAEVAREKPAGTYRILVLGGSTTYETSVEDWRQGSTAELERVLHERHGRTEVEVVNAGCGGWNSWESLVDLQFRGLALDPDLVVLYLGTNDVHTRLVPAGSYRRDNTGFRRPWEDDVGWWHRSTVLHGLAVRLKLARRNSVAARSEVEYDEDELDFEACLDANPPTYFADNLEQMIVLAKHRGAQVLAVTFAWCADKDDYAATPHYQRGFRETNEVIRAAAAEHSVGLFDYAAVMPADGSYWSDGRHVNVAGARAKAELYAEHIAAHCLPPRPEAAR